MSPGTPRVVRDLDGTDIPDDSDTCEPVGSCDECGINIYPENADTFLCDQCEFAINAGRQRGASR